MSQESPDLTSHWCPKCKCNTVSFKGHCPECGAAVEPKQEPQLFSLIGYTLQAVLKAEQGVILRLTRPPHTVDILRNGMSAQAIADLRQVQEDYDKPLHVAFFPAMGFHLPPGAKPTPYVLEIATQTARRELMVRTHSGELPPPLHEAATDLLPPECNEIFGMTITAQQPTRDGSNGIVLQLGDRYLLQVDLTGAMVFEIGGKIDAEFRVS